jgi:uncharacterized membrane protein (DUF441 family)
MLLNHPAQLLNLVKPTFGVLEAVDGHAVSVGICIITVGVITCVAETSIPPTAMKGKTKTICVFAWLSVTVVFTGVFPAALNVMLYVP